MSTNAISLDGQLVNIDGTGNRVAALIFGPKQVIVIAGMNKVCHDLDSAMVRARNIASPPNALRFDKKHLVLQMEAWRRLPLVIASVIRL